MEQVCQILEISRSGFYEWLNRKPSNREKRFKLVNLDTKWRLSQDTPVKPRGLLGSNFLKYYNKIMKTIEEKSQFFDMDEN